jgi:hypothetical protein
VQYPYTELNVRTLAKNLSFERESGRRIFKSLQAARRRGDKL